MRNKTTMGVVAAGHTVTAQAAAAVLRAGGNAFDAAVAAQFAACVAEPVLTSLGGGGFLLAHTAQGRDLLYDFFVQTPRRRRPPESVEFLPIAADFGTVQQEFHIGHGATATPGMVKGLFEVHCDLCTLPMTDLVAPAVDAARAGVRINALQAYIFDVVRAIYSATPAARAIYGSGRSEGCLLGEGETLRQPQLAGTLERLAREGADLFYRGEIAHAIGATCMREGGHLDAQDLAHYRVVRRAPLRVDYRGATLLSNPPPASGGMLVAFALRLLEAFDLEHHGFGARAHLDLLAAAMDATNMARLDAAGDANDIAGLSGMLDVELVARYRAEVADRARALRGTTHISVMDRAGNVASLSSSNGEGCGRMLSDTGIMLNNMLGEQDLQPGGFHRWPPDRRMTSMMAPSLVFLPDGGMAVLGSGGSNRLRTAILQVLVNLIDFRMPLTEAVDSPRIHAEDGMLNVEGGFDAEQLAPLLDRYQRRHLWEDRNLFFGGTHCVARTHAGLVGAGDPRRGGVVEVVA